MSRILIIGLLFSICFSPALVAQKIVIEDRIFDLFENPEKIKWLKHFRGRMNDLNDIGITLAYDGTNCKGIFSYLRSKEAFRLVGVLKNEVLHLQEVDQNGALSGYIKAELSDQSIKGTWSNYNYTVGNTLELEQIPEAVQLPSYCGDNKWIRKYQGFLKKEGLELILQKDNDQELKGIAFFQRDQESFLLKGSLTDQGFVVRLSDVNEKLRGSIRGKIVDDQIVESSYESPVGLQSPLQFTLKENLNVACVEYADYMVSYDLTFPKTKYASFNSWIEKETGRWIKDCQAHAKKIKKRHTSNLAPLRASLRAYGWCNVDMISDRLISGQLTFMNTWSQAEEGKSINYDLEKAKEIKLKDIFKKEFDQKKVIQNYINKAINKHKRYRDYEFRKWLAAEDFPYFTLRTEGISFATDFNMLYGQQQVVIPYLQLKKYLKPNSPIAHLIP